MSDGLCHLLVCCVPLGALVFFFIFAHLGELALG